MALFRYTFEIKHAELGKYRVVSGTDEAGVRAKAKQKEFWRENNLMAFHFSIRVSSVFKLWLKN